jgi:hypothetical protein
LSYLNRKSAGPSGTNRTTLAGIYNRPWYKFAEPVTKTVAIELSRNVIKAVALAHPEAGERLKAHPQVQTFRRS